jgi:hypothetical protein
MLSVAFGSEIQGRGMDCVERRGGPILGMDFLKNNIYLNFIDYF